MEEESVPSDEDIFEQERLQCNQLTDDFEKEHTEWEKKFHTSKGGVQEAEKPLVQRQSCSIPLV